MGDRDPVISVARVLPENNKVEGRSYVPTLLRRAGLRRPAAHEKKADGTEFSVEELRLIDGDELFIYSGSIAAEQEANDKALERVRRNPLWERLDAVRNDNVHLVDANLWGGGGLLWAEAMVDELRRHLVDDTG
jgi:iron complex transport system substrate-binding protein